MKSLIFSMLFVTTVSLVSAECPIDNVWVTLLGGVSNQGFCQISGSCGMSELLKPPNPRVLMYDAVTMPEKWSNQIELFSLDGKTCGAFFKFVMICFFFLPLERVLWPELT